MTRDPVVVVPADLDVEDRIVGPVTFRMAGWLAAAVVGVALVVAARGDIALTIVGVVVAAVGVAGAWLRPGGRPLGAWVVPLLAYRRRRRAGDPADEEVRVETAAGDAAPEGDDSAEAPTVSAAQNGRRRVAAVVVVGVVACLAVAAGVVALRVWSRPERGVPASPHQVPQGPAVAGPVVVVVPVDPFPGWEVTGDDDVLFGCGC